jgi:hypothetical protein
VGTGGYDQRAAGGYVRDRPFGLNLLLMPGEHVLWCDVPDCAVQTNVVVMLYYRLVDLWEIMKPFFPAILTTMIGQNIPTGDPVVEAAPTHPTGRCAVGCARLCRGLRNGLTQPRKRYSAGQPLRGCPAFSP